MCIRVKVRVNHQFAGIRTGIRIQVVSGGFYSTTVMQSGVRHSVQLSVTLGKLLEVPTLG